MRNRDKFEQIACGTIHTRPSQPTHIRLRKIDDELRRVIEQYEPQAIAMEDSFVSKDPLSSLKLGQARGVALLCATYYNLEVAEYAPKSVKKVVVGNGNADKSAVLKMLQILIPTISVSNFHESDACAIALCHVYSAQNALLRNH